MHLEVDGQKVDGLTHQLDEKMFDSGGMIVDEEG